MGLMGTSSIRQRSMLPTPAPGAGSTFSVGPTGQMQAHAPAPAPAPGKWVPGVQVGAQGRPGNIADMGPNSAGMAQTKSMVNPKNNLMFNTPDAGGVVPGAPAGNAVTNAGGPQMPAFDPNDPNNAALIGYRNG